MARSNNLAAHLASIKAKAESQVRASSPEAARALADRKVKTFHSTPVVNKPSDPHDVSKGWARKNESPDRATARVIKSELRDMKSSGASPERIQAYRAQFSGSDQAIFDHVAREQHIEFPKAGSPGDTKAARSDTPMSKQIVHVPERDKGLTSEQMIAASRARAEAAAKEEAGLQWKSMETGLMKPGLTVGEATGHRLSGGGHGGGNPYHDPKTGQFTSG